MPFLYVVPYLRLIFKYSYLIAPALLNHIRYDPGTGDSRPAQRDLISICNNVDLV